MFVAYDNGDGADHLDEAGREHSVDAGVMPFVRSWKTGEGDFRDVREDGHEAGACVCDGECLEP